MNKDIFAVSRNKEFRMSHPTQNSMVTLAFTGKLDNGEIFISVDEQNPLQTRLGNNDLPPTVEQAVLDMKVGERRKIRVPPEEGFGPRQKELLQTLDNQKMVDSLQPKPGMILSLKIDKDGVEQQVPATVILVEGSRITVDYNHPLAGHHLTYELSLLDRRPDGE
jgi:FKBP-type peptidyl-prolyl cis-trans isomerase 2